jgi:hypothetical protein
MAYMQVHFSLGAKHPARRGSATRARPALRDGELKTRHCP